MDAIWSDVTKGEWKEAASAAWAPLQQSHEYGEICCAIGLEVLRARLQDGRSLGYAQVLTRSFVGQRRFALLSRGPIWPDGFGQGAAANAALFTTIPMARMSVMMATPNSEDTLYGVPIMTGVTVAELPLVEDENVQREKMHGKWRNRLVRAENTDTPIERTAPTPPLIEMLLARESKQQKRQRYRNLPPQFLRSWAQLLPEETIVLVSRNRGEITAAMIFLMHGRTATYYLGWRDQEAGDSDHNALLWRGMRILREQGIERLDLGTLDTYNAPNLARFKLGAGGQARLIGKTYLLRSK